MRCQLRAFIVLAGCATAPGIGRAQAVTRIDSLLVGRILTVEDQRDSTAPALAEGLRHGNPTIRMLAGRAIARIRDPKFAARDSFPAPAAPPSYDDPAWRIRYRELAKQPVDCAKIYDGLEDRELAVELRAVDVLSPACVRDADIRQLRDYADGLPKTGSWRRGG